MGLQQTFSESLWQANFGGQIRKVLIEKAEQPAIEFLGRWHSWGELSDYADRIEKLLANAGISSEVPVGLVARTRAPHAGVILGFVASGRSISMIYAFQSAQAMATDLRSMRAQVVIADEHDWNETTVAAARDAGTMGISLSGDPARPVALVPSLELPGAGPFRPSTAERGIELLSSGTTGAPKRVLMPYAALSRIVLSMTLGVRPDDAAPPLVQFWPFANLAVGGLIARAYVGGRVVLLEKFKIDEWVAAIRKYRPTSASGPPPVIRQILASRIPREDLASVRYFSGGSGALEPEIQEEFERIYGIPVLWGYGATEFAGSVANWTPDLHKEFGGRKRGSVGRALPGTEIRIVDSETGVEVTRGERGLLEARVDLLGLDWIRTTDIASLDGDDFLFIHGRGDGAIVRGGFKILPERVVAVLRQHPDVMDAAVIALPDPILGQVPAAAVEPVAGRPLDAGILEAHIRASLPAHHVPRHFLILAELPRTASMKIDLVAVRRLFGGGGGKV